MEHRLGRTLRVFLVALAAAGFYRLAVVPWVEPRIRDTAAAVELSPEEAAAIRARADRRLALLKDVFPPGSWELEDPIVLESRQMRLLFKQYHTLPDGRVNLMPCTLVVLPDRNRVADGGSEGRTIVLRAPQGAVLEFDEPIDLRQGRLAKLVGGSLRGQVTIRGTPTAPGAEDDIEIVTRDVELAELEVRTNEAVQFRYGRSTGSGRALVAALLPRPGANEHGPNVGGVDTIRLDRDVQIRLEGFSSGLLPGAKPVEGSEAAVDAAPPPVHVTCSGPLCMNVSARVITLEDRVEVLREAPGGGTDQLTCDLLAIVLAGTDGAQAGTMRGGMEPVELQARGTPVVARSTAAGVEARGARLGYEIATRRILLDGEEPVSLAAQGTQMEAKSIDYTPGPPGDPGSLMAVGPGWLRTQSEGNPPAQVRWQKWLRMRPDGKGHVASLAGDAEVEIVAQGRLNASELHLWLDLAARDGAAPPAANGLGVDLSGIRPSRMLARGAVEIDSEQLAARTERMELWFKHPAAPVAPAAKPAASGKPRPQQAAATPAKPADPRPADRPTHGRFVASGALVRGLVLLSPAGNQVEEMSMEGDVRIAEEDRAAIAAGDPHAAAGIAISGDQAQVSRATRFDARAVVSGRPARITGRGVDLEGPMVEFDRGRNRMTVDGAGRLRLPMSGGMNGLEALAVAGAASPQPMQQPAAPQPLDVTWQGRMDFDGLTARFIDRVVTSSGATSLKAGSLDVVFAEPIDFGGQSAPRRNQRTEVARIACGSGVRIDSQTTAADGSKSTEQLFVRDLVLDRPTGNFTGSGPGRLTSTRFGQAPAMAMPAGGPVAGQQPAPAAPRADELTYLGVDFQRGMRGNINQRVMEFHQRVEAIWGPVAQWGDTLDPHAPAGLPPRVVTISSDVLSVGQSPVGPGQPRTSIELAAAGNILVEGESFTARSARLAWSESKDLLVFEGDGRTDAQLFRQMRVGAPTSTASAGKILYWRGLNRVDVEDARYLDFDQISGGGSLKVPGFGSAPQQQLGQPVPGT